MTYVIGFLLVVTLAIYFAIPLVVKRTSWQSACPRFEPLDTEAVLKLDPRIIEFLENSSSKLERLGFEPVARLVQFEQTSDVTVYLHLLRKNPEQDWAMAAAIIADVKEIHREALYVEFSTSCEDDTTLDTNNSPVPPGYTCGPWKRMFQLPRVQDLRHLYRLHRAAVAKYGSSTRPREIANDKVISFLCESMIREFRDQEERGVYYLDTADGRYRPTYKGAFLMTWKNMWPMKTIWALVARLRARKLVAELQSYA